MDIHLNMHERITFADILPDRGDMLTLKVIQSIKTKVDLSLEETEAIELKLTQHANGTASYVWNAEKAAAKGEKKITLTDPEMEVIMKQYKMLDEKKELAMRDLTLWTKLTGGK